MRIVRAVSPVQLDLVAARCAVALIVVLVCAPGSARAAAIVGLSDQRAEHLVAPEITDLNVRTVRLVVPWDAASTQPDVVERWLAAAKVIDATPLVSFERRTSDRCPQSPCKPPTVSAYRDAVEAFHLRWPGVSEFTAWNEPNHPIQPTAGNPELAADYHRALVAVCGRCTVAAGDLVDSASMKSYLVAYQARLESEPEVWALHDYGDLIYDRPSYLDWLLDRTTAPVWLTETGGLVYLRSSQDGATLLPYDERRGHRALQRLATILAERSRVERAYVYHLRQDPSADFDAALVRADGTRRPAYDTFAALVGPRPGPVTVPSTLVPSDERTAVASPATGASTPGAPTVTTTSTASALPPADAPRLASIRRTPSGWRVAMRCGRTAPSGCAGRLSLTVPSARTGRAAIVATTSFRLRDDRWRHVSIGDRRTRRTHRPITANVLIRGEAFVSREWSLKELR